MPMTGQLVTRGRSQFIVFPQELRFPGETVRLEPCGDGVQIVPENHPNFHRTGRAKNGRIRSVRLEKKSPA